EIEDTRIAPRDLLVAEAETSGNPRPKAFDEDIGALDQRVHDFPPGFALQIDGDAPLAEIAGDGERGLVAIATAEASRPVAFQRLDLHDVRPILGHQHCGIRAGYALTYVDDLQ